MRCPNCSAENAANHRFCSQCGIALTPAVCPGCSAPVTSDDRFCGACGWSLLGERRQVTVAFCDLVGSTALSAALDPEDLRELIRGFHAVCARVIGSLDGHIAQYLGDGVLIYFGYPKAHEDAAERSVRAGLEIISAAGALRHRHGDPLRVRVGIATGLVVIGGQRPIEGGAYGETPNLAARIQSLAKPDTIVIADSTRRLLGNAFQLKDLGEHNLRGITEPGRLWRVLRTNPGQTRWSAIRGTDRMPPLIGRDREAAILADAWEQAGAGRPRAVQMIGEPGIGKSRLAQVALDIAGKDGAADTIVLQCSPLQSQSALSPVIDWLRRTLFAGAVGAGAAQQALTALGRVCETSMPGDAEALPLLASLLGLPAELIGELPPGLASATPEARRSMTLQRLGALLRETPGRSRLLVAEDLHWADPSTLELLEQLVSGLVDQPLLVVATARPERIPPLWSGAECSRITLQRLSAEHAVALACHVAGDILLSSGILETIAERTDGVPLFLEEMAKSIAEACLPQGQGVRAKTPGGSDELPIPQSLNDSLMARLDRMANGKSVAQVAAMLGRDFSDELLAAVWYGTPDILRAGLDQLVAGEIVYARGEGERTEYSFKHALIRDVAYESMLKSTRISRHGEIGEAIEARFPQLAAERPELLAQHFTAARQPEKAVGYWIAAARGALQQNAHLETMAHVESALALCPALADEQTRNATELELRICAIPALLAAKGYGDPDVQATCERALALCEQLPGAPQQIVALFGLWTFNVVRANHAQSLSLAQRFLALAEASGSDDLLLEAHLIIGIAHLFLAHPKPARSHLEECVARYDPQRHGAHCYQFGQDPAAIALVYLLWLDWLEGEPVRALRQGERARRVIEQVKHPFSSSFVLSLSAWQALFAGNLDAAATLIEADIALCTEQQIRVFLAHGHVLRAWLARERGDLGSALPALEEALEFFRNTGARVFLTHWEAYLALARADAGDLQGAAEALDTAFRRMEESGERWAEPELYRLRGDLLTRRGAPPADCEAAYRRALEQARAHGFHGWGLRAATSLARCLTDSDKHPEALATLEEALAPFASQSIDERNLQEARDLADRLRARSAGG
ncbi:MAG: AAA family ATPase [Thiohalocapsa sp.]|nr:AAA family ATPase [Thiohalocapsa sp.]